MSGPPSSISTSRKRHSEEDHQRQPPPELPYHKINMRFVMAMLRAFKCGTICPTCYAIGNWDNLSHFARDCVLSNKLSEYVDWRAKITFTPEIYMCYMCGIEPGIVVSAGKSIHPSNFGGDCEYMDGPLCALYGAGLNPSFVKHLKTTSVGEDMSNAGGYQYWVKGNTRVKRDPRVNPSIFVLNELGRYYESRSRGHELVPSYEMFPFATAAPSLTTEEDPFTVPTQAA